MRDRLAHTQGSLVVVGQPCLCDPRRDDRLIEELADLLAAALIADVQQFPKPLESHADSKSMVVSPPGRDHRANERFRRKIID